MESFCGSVWDSVWDYDTPRILIIKNKTVGVVNRFIQCIIIAYIIGWVLVWEKGYQEFDSPTASVTSKVKGIAFTNSSLLEEHLWDPADYVIPPQEESAFFVMTNAIVTRNQVQGLCPELPSQSSRCKSDSDCTAGYHDSQSNGVLTGKCNKGVNTCEIYGWCPVENDAVIPKPAILEEAENFTVLIKNSITFPKFQFSKRNILSSANESYLKVCRFHQKNDPTCPIFTLGDMVRDAGEDFQELSVQGGVMGILIKWNCNLDRPASECFPVYKFRRLDKSTTEALSPGYNFRFAKYNINEKGKQTRTLYKAYGIRFIIDVFGKAGKFNIIPTLINVGSGLALLGMATIVCDIIALNILKKKRHYEEMKFKSINDGELALLEEGS
ncbi:P2X purinoceptor 4a isoform X1 [Leucoraja erinacea]|uniref:P2X purinoceptor 4a isoform X1 n=1 Tax=Leucoraja erinaceus TaxID=7782 RepID=UPI002458F1C1|nr:P2X purinoceptor 4a isoform X1 [Leucoraja erinacea]